jgi:hypothetical protein
VAISPGVLFNVTLSARQSWYRLESRVHLVQKGRSKMQRRPVRVAVVVSVLFTLGLAITAAVQVHSAQAQGQARSQAQAATNPLVDIVVVLHTPACIVTHYAQDAIPAGQAPCAHSNFMQTQTVLRSQAIARHEPYAL